MPELEHGHPIDPFTSAHVSKADSIRARADGQALMGSVCSWRTLRQLEPIRAAATTHSDGEEIHMRFDKLKALSGGAA